MWRSESPAPSEHQARRMGGWCDPMSIIEGRCLRRACRDQSIETTFFGYHNRDAPENRATYERLYAKGLPHAQGSRS